MGRYLIVGGQGGIGEAAARRLVSAGHEVIITGRDAEDVAATAEGLPATGVVLDVLDGGAGAVLAEAAGDRLDGLIYAVGTINLKPFERLTEQDFLNDFSVNALGAAKAIQAVLPALRKSEAGAGIVLFSSVAVDQGFAAHASIAMAKGAVAALVRSLAAEFAPQIRVNAIAPSLVDTPLGRKVASSEKMAEAVAKMHPLPRLGDADEIAAMAVMLLSAEAGWITGQVIAIDGGRSTLRIRS